jgi:ABC-type spermidine/putrescine transport system permease subunit II
MRASEPFRPDWMGLALVVTLAIVIIGPMLVVGLWAFAEQWRYPAVVPQQWGLRYWDMTLSRPDVWTALRTSLQLSVVVTVVSAAICLPARRPKKVASATDMPLAYPAPVRGIPAAVRPAA